MEIGNKIENAMRYDTMEPSTEARKLAAIRGHSSLMDGHTERLSRTAVRVLVLLALLYALFAGLRTVADPDLGWQLATGRYVIQHHQIPSFDVFSYTAAGNEWIYPPFAGVLFYGLFVAWGYAGISWFSALACVATIALMLRKGSAAAAALAIVAVPIIAIRTTPRADLFTTLLFTAFLGELWLFQRRSQARLWVLPILMLLWVNLHPGFVAGLGLMAAYLLIEGLELPFPERRAAALQRLRSAWPWLALTAAATLINPWGPRIYAVLLRQNRAIQLHSVFIEEWSSIPLSLHTLAQAFAWREPESAYWWLVTIAIVVIGLALWRRQPGVALFTAAAVYLSLRHIRFHGLFAIIAVVIGGTILAEAVRDYRRKSSGLLSPGTRRALPGLPVIVAVFIAALFALTCVRIADLTSNRYYVLSSANSQFGPGESWWFPERAAAFIEHQDLPGNIFHAYNTGGFLAWRLGPRYRDYIDGRAIPFGNDLFVRNQQLLLQPPDSPAWQAEAESRNINVLLLSLARFSELGSINLQAYCQSTMWRPIYLDEVSVVLLRNRPENRPWLDRLQIDCHKQQFALRPPFSRADVFNFCANTGAVLFVLGQDQEALRALDRAQAIYPFDPGVHLTRAQLFQQERRFDDAEREYRAALSRKQTDVAWYALGGLYASEQRYAEAAHAIGISTKLSFHPYHYYLGLGSVQLALKQPQRALESFAQAEKHSPFQGAATGLGNEFYAKLEDGRAKAWNSLGELPQAIAAAQRAVQRTPDSPIRWNSLAELYHSAGEEQLSQQARQRSRELRAQATLAK